MKRLTIHRDLDLDNDQVLAFERAYALFFDATRNRSRRDFARWLLGRAAHAYAVSSWDDRTTWWAFDLRPVTPEEAQANKLLADLPPTSNEAG